MIKIVFTFFLIFPFRLLAQVESTDTLLWSGKHLAWENFKGNYDTVIYNRQYGATTFWKVRYQYRPLLFQSEIDFIVYAWFDANKSWVSPKNSYNKTLLLHEQGHFDLAELLARQFKKQLSETTFSRTNYADSIKRIFNNLLIDAYATQEKYDMETNHGMNGKRQAYWQIFIAAALKKLEGFASRNITAKLIR